MIPIPLAAARDYRRFGWFSTGVSDLRPGTRRELGHEEAKGEARAGRMPALPGGVCDGWPRCLGLSEYAPKMGSGTC